jgi:hypothetical protein
MAHRETVLIASFITLILTGCPATMPFQSDSDIPSGRKAVFLMTATLKNSYQPSVRLEPSFVAVCRKGATDSSGCVLFRVDDKARPTTGEAEGGNRYFLRMELESGEYEIPVLDGYDFVLGAFVVPIHADLNSSGTGVFYLGHVLATMRERKAGEFRAGPPEIGWGLPGLIIAAATKFGFYGGTFEVEITDQSEQDIAGFMNRFAALRGTDIQNAILPTFDRAKAQRRWEADPTNRLRDTH